MSRPRRRYRLYQEARRLLRQARPPGDKDDTIRLPKIVEIIRKTIKAWLDDTPSFSAKYFSSYLIVHDATCGSQLAVIEFKEDHLIINVAQGKDMLGLLTGIISDGSKVSYSDPGLHTRVKFVVNQAYRQQGH